MTTCPSWCVGDVSDKEHWAEPGSAAWPTVRSTAYPAGQYDVTAAPTWGECDGLEPAVLLFIQRADDGDVAESIDLTPDEARRVAERLMVAAEAVSA